MKKLAMYYKELEGSKVLCELCPHYCVLDNDEYGKCKVRVNNDGKLFTINYGDVASIAIDPIEKKPLYNFYPGSQVISVATYGCNFSCKFCQNHRISQNVVDARYLDSDNLVELIGETSDSIGIAFTYNEPFIWYEYIYEISKKIKKEYPDKKIIIISNGFINERPFLDLLPYIDCLNIDLKSYNNDFYENICGGKLDPVKRIIELAIKSKAHVEITTLMITNQVDDIEQMKDIAEFIGSFDKSTPLHLSRYYPNYKYEEEATPLSKMLDAQEPVREYLEYVYLGNIAGVDTNTYCPKCNTLLIERNGYETRNHMTSVICSSCNYKINVKND